ncbi:hypothetical protein [Chondrinema litorale]|uniref:hypothetical protein n=1 Tax=Chondrinema litorale TaxID=2994555 RepID=UPI002542E1E4|nr:hypothetical protein [Chondrinema litorale]UZR99764.1 hypothetical protein OQ292_37825 [Chondrinema litorale]
MINYKHLALLLILAVFNLGCQDEETESIEKGESGYIIFGHFYGECMGESCVEIFKLEADRLLEDTKDKYPLQSSYYEGEYRTLSNAKFDKVRDMFFSFPDELFDYPQTIIGEPDAGDWGGLYIEYNFEGIRKYWLLDQMKDNVPTELHAFIDKVNLSIDLIND